MKKPEADTNKAWVLMQLGQAQASHFHGRLTIIFEKGKIRRVEKLQSLLPPKQ